MESSGRRRLAFGEPEADVVRGVRDVTREYAFADQENERDAPPYGMAHGKQLSVRASVRASRGDPMRASTSVRASLPSLPFGAAAPRLSGNPVSGPAADDERGSDTSAIGGVLGELSGVGDALSLPPLDDDAWAAGVHEATWAVARAFGFQAFNLNPATVDLSQSQYVPATAFLAGDHVQELLGNEVLRTHAVGGPEEGLSFDVTVRQRFCRAVWQLHSTIFGAYRTWLSHVGLPHARLAAAESALTGAAWDDAGAVNGLLMELGAYFLLWSEASSLRHCPEALWFLYHAMSMSPAMARLWECCAGLVPIPGARDRRLVMRNLLQADIGTLQASFRHFPWNGLPASNLEMLSALAGKLPAPSGAPAARGTSLAHPLQGDEALLEDLVAMGDGGSFMDRVIQPLFVVVAFEMDHLAQQGEEICFRIGYDDINESLTHPGIVRRTLKALGATGAELRSGEAHSAFDGILGLGCKPVPATGREGSGGDMRAVSTSPSRFDDQRAAAFWSEKVFTKTFYERRSWLAIYRSFYRVFCIQAVMLHLLIAAAFTEGMWSTRPAWVVLSSAVITHALCAALERFSNAWMNGRQANPLDKQRSSWAWMEGRLGKKSAAAKRGSAEEGGETEAECPLESARQRRRPVPLEGAPVLGFIGVFEWVLVFFGLAAFFVLQFLTVPGLSEMARTYWLFAAGGYTAAMLGHGILTTRDGYTVGLTASLRLPRFFAAHSSRPKPSFWLCGDLSIGMADWGLLFLFWLGTFSMKGAFDYFVLWKPLVEPVRLLLENRDLWLPCNRELLIEAIPMIPCVDGIWLLVVIRLIPSFLISFIDLAVAYQLMLIFYGLVRGLVALDVGVISDFSALIREFHCAPLLWWAKAMSATGNRNSVAMVSLLSTAAAADLLADGSHTPRSESDCAGGSASGSSTPSVTTRYRRKHRSVNGIGHSGGVGGPVSSAASEVSLADMRSAAAFAQRKDIQATMMSTSDELVAMWDSFAVAWDEVVDDLREADLLSNAERDNLRFMRLGYSVQGVRPILLPLFWTAGQVQKVVDSGLVDLQQALVLAEMRCLLVYLGSALGVLPDAFCDAVMQASFCTEILDQHHSQSRERMAHSTVRLLAALQGVASCKTYMPEDLARRHALHGDVLSALLELLRCMEVECQAVRMAAKSRRRISRNSVPGKTEVAAAEVLLAETKSLQATMLEDPSSLSSCLRMLHDDDVDDDIGMPHSVVSSHSDEAQTLIRVVQVLLKMFTVTPANAKPSSKEAQRVLGFFMSSLANRKLAKPPPLHEMPSWTTLTPLYEEDVLFALDAQALSRELDCELAGINGMADLLTETEDNVSLMAYLRSCYPKDWECFKERLGEQLGGMDLSATVESDFEAGAPLHELGLQLQLWASFRGQLLARTVRGMMCYDKALRILARMEYPSAAAASSAGGLPKIGQAGAAQSQYEAWLDRLVEKKFCHVVSAQVYGTARASKIARQRWQAESLDTLLEVYSALKVAFLDTAPTERGPTQFSVLVRGRRGGAADGREWDPLELWAMQRVDECYRVRLPQNRYSGRGVIVGEGKPENQNHAVIFAHGEALQTIDMNQDNNLAEALKMRNLLQELRPEYIKKAPNIGDRLAASINSGSPMLATEMQRQQLKVRVHREWIFSEKSGALGLFAASAEFAFGTIIQRTLDHPAHVRLHYGHPDVFNKLHTMTRGGVSKATRQLHIAEDVFAGMNHTLRGARLKYSEYISVGKGRDMGFDSINAFEIKVAGGTGNAVISRDVWRLATRLDLFRCLHLYYSFAGYYVNTWMLMFTIYVSIFSLLFFSFAHMTTVIYERLDPVFNKYTIEFNWEDTYKAEGLIQLGILSVLPYLAELVLEKGVVSAVLNILYQIIAGSLVFFIARQQTSRVYFEEALQYGGAQYLATGRGFAITSSSFIKLYTNYARTHIFYGFELFFMCILFYILDDCFDCNKGAITWGVWLVAASLIFAPFWFNPNGFSTSKVKKDYSAWKQWMKGEVDPITGTSWSTWNRKQLEKVRNDRRNQTSPRLAAFSSILVQTAPLCLLAFAAVSRLDLELDLPGPAILQTKWISFIIATAIVWTLVCVTLSVGARFKAAAQQRSWRIYGFWMSIAVVLFLIAYLAALSRWYSGNGFTNLLLILYANLSLVMAAHRAAIHLATRSPSARAAVDAGFHFCDTVCGAVLLATVGLLSLIGIVAWAQNQLLFGTGFARSIRRGQLVRVLNSGGGGDGSGQARKGQGDRLNADAVAEAMDAVRSGTRGP
ncbi:hypothetical protein FOA52_010846 [Chlamydomonas sp. UWO 241]|nr:hypothetical protein FOA52_010846 [Chlamydomonas sp. UWO 241]